MKEIYLDNAASAKPYDEVIEAVLNSMKNHYGNAFSSHRRGAAAAQIIRDSASKVSSVLGTSRWNVVFNSGGTESNVMAILGSAPRGKKNTVVTTTLEHSSTMGAVERLKNSGLNTVFIKAGATGVIDPSAFIPHLNGETALVTMVHVASEMCTVLPVNEVAKLVKQKAPGALFHVDAVQAAAQLPRLDYCPQVDLVTLSAHKFHGPTGVGILAMRPKVTLKPLFYQGAFSEGMRPGTMNTFGIEATGVAAAILEKRRTQGSAHMERLCDLFISLICSGSIRQLGLPEARAKGMLVVAVARAKSEVLLNTMEKYGLLASAGSACHSTRKKPSQALVDAGLKPNEAVIRFSLSFDTTEDEIKEASKIFQKSVFEVQNSKAGK